MNNEVHLSTEAISAFVDGELSPGPRARAARHIQGCFECAYAVGVQQQAKESLRGGEISIPHSLMSRLGEIPFSADLGEDSLEDVGLYADERGRFEFRVAAPAPRPHDQRGGRRGRTLRGAALAVAVAGAVTLPVTPTSAHSALRGHQIASSKVVHRPTEQITVRHDR